jgi:hypothetical protein
MRPASEVIIERLGKVLRTEIDEITRELLPQPWVDLFKHLDEKERSRVEARTRREKNLVPPNPR